MKHLLLTLILVSNVVWADCYTRTVSRSDADDNVSAEAVSVCSSGEVQKRPVKVGDTILETEVGKSKITKYFNHQNSQCRMFTERYEIDKRLRVYHGVICQVDNLGTNWIVVDKW